MILSHSHIGGQRIYWLLGGLMALGTTLLLFRIYWTKDLIYWSLTWNLFLALVPLIVSRAIMILEEHMNKLTLVFASIFWLLFFPNAPYILTDLFHLSTRNGMPKWYDLLMVLTFAWTGLFMGIVSLMDIQNIYSRKFSETTSWVVTLLSIFLGSFGIYLGRYLRWNSWDVVTSPQPLISDIYQILINPIGHPRTVGVTLVFSAFLLLVYLSFYFVSKSEVSRR